MGCSAVSGALLTIAGNTYPSANNTYNLGSSSYRWAVGYFVALAGVTDGSNAASGMIGEFISSSIASGSAVSLTTATTANVTSISLTAGDWDVTGLVEFIATSATVAANAPLYAGIGSTGATLTDSQYSLMRAGAMTTTSYSPWNCIDTPVVRLSITSTTTIYLQAQATFAAGTMTAYGTIRARRVR